MLNEKYEKIQQKLTYALTQKTELEQTNATLVNQLKQLKQFAQSKHERPKTEMQTIQVQTDETEATNQKRQQEYDTLQTRYNDLNLKYTNLQSDFITIDNTTKKQSGLIALFKNRNQSYWKIKQSEQRLKQSNSEQLLEIERLKRSNSQQQLETQRLKSTLRENNHSIFYAESLRRGQRVKNAIKDLNILISKTNRPTHADKAILGIIEYLNTGLSAEDPNHYFKQNKSVLKKHISTLQYTAPSMINSILNVIITTIAFCSIIGIFMLWVTGVLKTNADKNGSMFAFMVFGSKQKSEREIAAIANANGLSIMSNIG